MKAKNFSPAWAGAGIVSGFAASLCCVTPISALIVGVSGSAASFSWIEPARPYLIALSMGALLFAWYIKLKPGKQDTDCNCGISPKTSFFRSKVFLGIVTVFSVAVMMFPLYAGMFSEPAPAITAVSNERSKQVKFKIQGMTCEACEGHINGELSKLPGVASYRTSYANQSSLVTFYPSKVDVNTIEKAINKTGYKVERSNDTTASQKVPVQTSTAGEKCCYETK